MRIACLVGALSVAMLCGGCLSLSENAPAELHSAKASLDEAYDRDVDDFLPVTVEKSKVAFDRGLELYRMSEDYKAADRVAMAMDARNASIVKANESRRLSGSAIELFSDLKTWDQNIGSYALMKSEAGAAGELRMRMANIQSGDISDDFLIVKSVAYFETDDASLENSAFEDVERLIFLLRKHEPMFVELRGYADHRGPQNHNKTLALKRAQAVARLLRENGISQERIKITAVGDELALEDTTDPARLQLDRRVEAKLTVLSH